MVHVISHKLYKVKANAASYFYYKNIKNGFIKSGFYIYPPDSMLIYIMEIDTIKNLFSFIYKGRLCESYLSGPISLLNQNNLVTYIG